MNFIRAYFDEVTNCLSKFNNKHFNKAITEFKNLRKRNGRLFIIGIGGSAANSSHAANDFRKLCMINAIAPVDNISEITARTNDEGFDNIFIDSLLVSKISGKDLLLIFSVGGSKLKKKVSINIIKAIKFVKKKKVKVISIVGRKDGYAYKNSNICFFTDIQNKKFVTPVCESVQSLIWHLFVSHPTLKIKNTTW